MHADTTPEERLIVTVAALIAEPRDHPIRHAAIGASSPIPAAACMLRRHEGQELRLSLNESRRANPFTDGSRELFDQAGQGRIDLFFLGGGQIDGAANINLVGTGPYPQSSVRFPGSFGSAFMYFTVPRVILFREEHTRRVMVEKVDFISAPGTSPPGVWRRGGPQSLVTGLCVFDFDRSRARFVLRSVHRGTSVADVVAATGFGFDIPGTVPETKLPTPEQIALLRGPVRAEMETNYPDFCGRVWGRHAA